MNIIDLSILGVISISFIIGIYYGFSHSLVKIASFIDSWFISLIFYPYITKRIVQRFPNILENIIYYSDGSSRIPFADRNIPVSSLSADQAIQIVEKSGLPNPFQGALENNLINGNLGGLTTTGQYMDYTIANVIINIISFFAIFIVLEIIFGFIISITENVLGFPMLKKFDTLLAGVLGVFRGILFLFVVFSFLPFLYLAVPSNLINTLLAGSKFINFFLDANFFNTLIRGVF